MGDQGARSGDLAVGRPRRSPTRESEKEEEEEEKITGGKRNRGNEKREMGWKRERERGREREKERRRGEVNRQDYGSRAGLRRPCCLGVCSRALLSLISQWICRVLFLFSFTIPSIIPFSVHPSLLLLSLNLQPAGYK